MQSLPSAQPDSFCILASSVAPGAANSTLQLKSSVPATCISEGLLHSSLAAPATRHAKCSLSVSGCAYLQVTAAQVTQLPGCTSHKPCKMELPLSVLRCAYLQDTAAQVAAMTAELNQLADQMLPEGTTSAKLQGKNDKSLRQRLLDSWDGKVSP